MLRWEMGDTLRDLDQPGWSIERPDHVELPGFTGSRAYPGLASSTQQASRAVPGSAL